MTVEGRLAIAMAIPKNALSVMLTLSTAHMTQADNDLLAAQAGIETRGDRAGTQAASEVWLPMGYVVSYRYGWLIQLYNDPDQLDREAAETRAEGYSEAFVNVLRIARQSGVFLVRLDADGDTIDELPIFDW